MDAEIENARAAWNWALERGQVERLDQAIDGLCRFYDWRLRYQEGEAVCRAAAEQLEATVSGDGLRVWAKVLTWLSVFSQALGRTELAHQLLQQSLTLLGAPDLDDQVTRSERAFALLLMGLAVWGSDLEEAKQVCEQSLALYRALGDQWGAANVLHESAMIAWGLGAQSETRHLYEQSLAIRQALDDRRGVASSLGSLAWMARSQWQFEEAERLNRQSSAILQEIGDPTGIVKGLEGLATTCYCAGNFGKAHSLLEEIVAVYRDLGVHNQYTLWGGSMDRVHLHLGRYEQTRAVVQMALTHARETDTPAGIAYPLLTLGQVALAGEAYAEAQRFLHKGIAILQEIGHRAELGPVLALLGIATRGLGQLPQAQQHLYEALRTVPAKLSLGLLEHTMYTLSAMALLLADQGEKERAVELYALASRYPFVANSRWFEDVAGQHIAAIAATLPPEVVTAAQERGRARDLDATVAELLAELEEQ
jgi:tetratricopeptide (TPR) repeat protein